MAVPAPAPEEQQPGAPPILMTFHAPGRLPGIPGGEIAPGAYLIDYEARTVTPVTDRLLAAREKEERAAAAAALDTDAAAAAAAAAKGKTKTDDADVAR